MPLDPQGGDGDEEADDAGQQRGSHQADQERRACRHHQESAGVGPDGKQADMPERQQSGESKQHVVADSQDHEDEDLMRNSELVVAAEQERQGDREGQGGQHGSESRRRTARGASHPHHSFSAMRSGKSPRGLQSSTAMMIRNEMTSLYSDDR